MNSVKVRQVACMNRYSGETSRSKTPAPNALSSQIKAGFATQCKVFRVIKRINCCYGIMPQTIARAGNIEGKVRSINACLVNSEAIRVEGIETFASGEGLLYQ